MQKGKLIFSSLLVAAALSLAITSVQACTLVFSNDHPQVKVVARSMDLFMDDQPLFVVYPRGMTKSGEAGANSYQWQSKYGSVSITALHKHLASEGLNEKGLSVALLYLDQSQYETRNLKRPGVSNLVWAQYLLDNFSTVSDALQGMKQVQIVSKTMLDRHWPLHVALEDSTGDSAMIEFIHGKMVVHHGKQYTVLTNEPSYEEQMANLKRYKLFGGTLPMPGDIDPLSRFVRASSYLKTLPAPKDEIQGLAGVLSVIRTTMVPFGAEDTSHGVSTDVWPTRWITLKDLMHPTYYFSSTSAPNIVWIDFAKLHFEQGAKVMTLDPRDPAFAGEISSKLHAASS